MVSKSVCYFVLLVIRIRFDKKQLLHEAQESSGRVSVVINRDTIPFATTFNVTITTREYVESFFLTADHSIAIPNVGMTIIFITNH